MTKQKKQIKNNKSQATDIRTYKGKTQKQFLEAQLHNLLNIQGVSGKEIRVSNYLLKELSNLKYNFLRLDEYGNIHMEVNVGNGEGAIVHLNSHMDTVSGVREDKVINNDSGVYTAMLPDGTRGILGADDRAGIATILTILFFPPTFNGKFRVSFYKEEEIGCVGSTNSDKSVLKDVDLAITFDRRGNSDIVVGCWGQAFASNAVADWLESVSNENGFGFSATEGGISDACTVSEQGVNSVNLSVGYYNEHTTSEYLVFSELYNTLEFAKCAISEINTAKDTFGSVPSTNDWSSAGSYSSGTYYNQYNDSPLYSPLGFYDEDCGKVIITDGLSEMSLDSDELEYLIADLKRAKVQMDSATLAKDYLDEI